MQTVPPEVWANFERRLDEARVPVPQRAHYRKWVGAAKSPLDLAPGLASSRGQPSI